MKFEIYDFDTNSNISDEALRKLLNASFPGFFEKHIFFKQEPHSRLVACVGNELLGHVGIEKRVFSVSDQVIRVVGLIDLCVAEKYRSQGIGTALIRAAESKFSDREFSVLMADNPKLYRRLNYIQLSPAPSRWFAIDELKSHSIIERDLSDCFMYKQLSARKWPDGKIDLLGYLF